MTWWEAVILGFVQGAAEFLPISSSGHLVMAQAVMDIEIPGIAFEIAVHVATLVSILLVYRSRVVELTRGAVTGDRSAWEYIGLLVVATIPAEMAASAISCTTCSSWSASRARSRASSRLAWARAWRHGGMEAEGSRW